MKKYLVTVVPIRFASYEEEVLAENETEAINKAVKIGYERDHPSPKPLIYAWSATAELFKDPEVAVATTPIQMFRKIGPTVYAQQWFPGIIIVGVNYKKGANPEAWVNRIYGKQPIKAGDWIVTDNNGHTQALSAERFAEEYEEA